MDILDMTLISLNYTHIPYGTLIYGPNNLVGDDPKTTKQTKSTHFTIICNDA
jgi:hypothetical protein